MHDPGTTEDGHVLFMDLEHEIPKGDGHRYSASRRCPRPATLEL
ncbi:MAG: hypothetical protein AVDCRST_MAG25-2128 [uncultured Rubrobacteraceae bacterium]|uniref:Uncharacterized protein n=1 Tax=uncultured Rubrobacteraceae bacterium TaxID=349277 RepID=A0A6J4RN74_9ACTN|nr:MAG: hypothetical protein AVDCRST_MAG25-2128 [uncultured Rubrobacteraceae bacterium]